MPKRRIAVLRIEKCGDCPHVKYGDSYSFDGFDRGVDWKCGKKKLKVISVFVERPSEEPKEVPEWCPLTTEMVDE